MSSEDPTVPIIGSVRRTGLADEIAGMLREYITRGGFRPGDRLPTTANLAEMLGVGVPTLREAINQLKAFGTLEVRHGSGVYVGDAGEQFFLANTSLPPFTRKRILDTLETRLLIDPAVAALAAERATDAQLAKLSQFVATEARDTTDPDAHFASGFHLETAVISGNDVLTDLERVILLSFRWQYNRILCAIRDPLEENRQHRAIFEAITKRDPIAATELSRKHISEIVAGVEHSKSAAAVMAELGIE